MKSNTKRLEGKYLKMFDLKNVLMYVLPASGLSDKPSIYTNKTAIITRLEALENPWWEYSTENKAKKVVE